MTPSSIRSPLQFISSTIQRNATPTPRAFHRPSIKDTFSVNASLRNQSNNVSAERSEADKIVDGMDFGQLCDEFQCISSPSVESTARLLVRDILELRQSDSVYATSVVYQDPVRRFKGSDKYKRRIWAADALDNPTTSVQKMAMLSTSILIIEWTLSGNLKPVGNLVLKVTSEFTLNQISGQVIEHKELWDTSASSSLLVETYFWASRRLFAISEAGRDASDVIKDLTKRITSDNNENVGMYPDISGDPTKFFFQRDDGFQQDLYQIALLLAVAYFVIEFLRATI